MRGDALARRSLPRTVSGQGVEGAGEECVAGPADVTGTCARRRDGSLREAPGALGELLLGRENVCGEERVLPAAGTTLQDCAIVGQHADLLGTVASHEGYSPVRSA